MERKKITVLMKIMPDSKAIETNQYYYFETSSKQWKEVQVGKDNTISEVHV